MAESFKTFWMGGHGPFFYDENGTYEAALEATDDDTFDYSALAITAFRTDGATAMVGADMGDGNITNVGDIALDSISADGTTIQVLMTDDTVGAFEILEAANSYLKFNTSNGSELITASKAMSLLSTLTVAGQTDLNGDINLGNAVTDSLTFVGRPDSDIIPIAHNSHDLGANTLEWTEIHGVQGYFDQVGPFGDADLLSLAANQFTVAGEIEGTTLDINGTSIVRSIYPEADSTYDLGEVGTPRRWRLLHVDDIVLDASAGNPQIGPTEDTDLLVLNTGILTLNGQMAFEASAEDKISLYDNRLGAANMYGFGYEAGGYLTNRALTGFRWYINHVADGGTSNYMQLTASGLYLSQELGVGIAPTNNRPLHLYRDAAVSGAMLVLEENNSSGYPMLKMDRASTARGIGLQFYNNATYQWFVGSPYNGGVGSNDLHICSGGHTLSTDSRWTINSSGDTQQDGDLLVDGGQIGLTADSDLLSLAANRFTINGVPNLSQQVVNVTAATVYDLNKGNILLQRGAGSTVSTLTVNGATATEGDIVVIQDQGVAGAYCTLTDAAGGANQMFLSGSANFTFTNTQSTIMLKYSTTAGGWCEVSRSVN